MNGKFKKPIVVKNGEHVCINGELYHEDPERSERLYVAYVHVGGSYVDDDGCWWEGTKYEYLPRNFIARVMQWNDGHPIGFLGFMFVPLVICTIMMLAIALNVGFEFNAVSCLFFTMLFFSLVELVWVGKELVAELSDLLWQSHNKREWLKRDDTAAYEKKLEAMADEQ